MSEWYTTEMNEDLLALLIEQATVRDPNWAAEGYFTSATGHPCFIHRPDASHITITDIALSLSRIPRWGGRTRATGYAYSVAQHSVLCSLLVPQEDALEALLHDASEAYLGDVISPLKRVLKPLYAPLERAWMRQIGLLFNARLESLPVSVKCADLIALEVERWDLMRQHGAAVWGHEVRPTSLPLTEPMRETEAYFYFINRYNELKR